MFSTISGWIDHKKDDAVSDVLSAKAPLFRVVSAFSCVINILVLAVPLYMLQVYDRVLSSRSEETLILLTLIAVVALAAYGALDALRLRLLTRVSMYVAETVS